MYKQPIILFGIVIPLLLVAGLIGISFVFRGKVMTSYDSKAKSYKDFETNKMIALDTEAQIVRQRDAFQQWSEILEQDSFSLLGTNLRMLEKKLPPKEFQQPLSERMNNKLGFGNASAQKSAAVKFNVKGTYRTVQKGLIELETRMPNLQLQDLRMAPSSASDASLLNIQVTYTAWEK